MDGPSLVVIMFAIALNGTPLAAYRTSFNSTLAACLQVHKAFLKPDDVKAVKGIDLDISVECQTPSTGDRPPLGAPKLFPPDPPPSPPGTNSETGT